METPTELQSMNFLELLTEIGSKIRPREVEIFKNKLKVKERVPSSLLDDIDSREWHSGLKFLKKLQEEGYLAEDNLELLEELLLAIERQDLLQELSEFEKKVKTSSDVEGAVARETEAHQSIFQRVASYISNLWRSITGRGRRTITPRVTHGMYLSNRTTFSVLRSVIKHAGSGVCTKEV
ncbi:uncharacterized protein LOC116287439 [Actinia tenebrosa]|uniref:Uncharacterized protein LOC116287439 n=1 Tax=Actinia tenebrosa TaxID=6105 RepID=A0A6P8H3F2_ACTTE|nr:uncharacterized protein LOC116287439 [Actinia tenebrosa]